MPDWGQSSFWSNHERLTLFRSPCRGTAMAWNHRQKNIATKAKPAIFGGLFILSVRQTEAAHETIKSQAHSALPGGGSAAWLTASVPETGAVVFLEHAQTIRANSHSSKRKSSTLPSQGRDACPCCGYQAISYNSCRNRHCPKCQAQARERWLAARERELLDTSYFHVVFTVPHELNVLALENPVCSTICYSPPAHKPCWKSHPIRNTWEPRSV